MIQARPRRDRQVTAIARSLAERGKRGQMLLVLNFQNELSRPPLRKMFESRVPESRLSRAPLQSGPNAVHDGGIHTEPSHQNEVALLAGTFDGDAPDVSSQHLTRDDNVSQLLQPAGQPKLVAKHVRGAAGPHGEPHVCSYDSLQSFIDRAIAAGNDDFAEAGCG